MMAVQNGLAHCSIYEVEEGLSSKSKLHHQALFEEHGFLNFFYSRNAADPNVSFYEWKPANYGDDSTFNTMYKIMAYENTFVFYLCREVIQLELMYFILRRPRSNSSLCTLVYLFIRPRLELDPPPASLEQGENSVQIYPASQASASGSGSYVPGPFVDPNINFFGTSSDQWFPVADNSQFPTQPDYAEDEFLDR
jgi:hypothetical protein